MRAVCSKRDLPRSEPLCPMQPTRVCPRREFCLPGWTGSSWGRRIPGAGRACIFPKQTPGKYGCPPDVPVDIRADPRSGVARSSCEGGAAHKVLAIPGPDVRYLNSDWASDFTFLSLGFLISELGRIIICYRVVYGPSPPSTPLLAENWPL